MHAIAPTAETSNPCDLTSPALAAWLDTGKSLISQKRELDWQFADWIATGKREGYAVQVGFDFLAESLGLAPKRLKLAAVASERFPEHMRDAALSLEHHIGAAVIDGPDALNLLQQARQKKWTPEQLTVEAKRAKAAADDSDTPFALPDESAMLDSFIRHWNRLPRLVRADAAELIAEAQLEEIDL